MLLVNVTWIFNNGVYRFPGTIIQTLKETAVSACVASNAADLFYFGSSQTDSMEGFQSLER